MPITYLHTAVELPSTTGFPKDTTVWTFNFQSPTLNASDLHGQVIANLEDFINGPNPTRPLSSYISGSVSRLDGACSIKSDDVSAHLDGAPGAPHAGTATFTLGLPDGVFNLPSEVAFCLSTRTAGSFPEGPHAGPRPASRHRGRVYIGPLRDLCIEQTLPNSDALIDPLFQDDVIAAAERLGLNAGTAVWSVWSRARAAMDEVHSGWVDNAVDIQRRRGITQYSRTIFVL